MMFLAMFRKPMLPAAAVLWASLAASCSGNVAPLPEDAPTRVPAAAELGQDAQAGIAGLAFRTAAQDASAAPGPAVAGAMAEARIAFTATVLNDGRLLVVAGQGGDGDSLSSAEVFDPPAGKWSATGPMSQAREGHTATLLKDGRVLVAGGRNVADAAVLSSAEIYDPSKGTWESAGDMAEVRKLHRAVLLTDGRVLVTGGVNDDHELSNTTELYDPAAGTWSQTGEMLKARQVHTATLLPDGKVLVTGGSGDFYAGETTETYNPATGAWSDTGLMEEGRFAATATVLKDGRMLVTGGLETFQETARGVRTAEVYDPSTGVWSPAGDTKIIRNSHTASLLPDGMVLIAGGKLWAYVA